MEYLRMKI